MAKDGVYITAENAEKIDGFSGPFTNNRSTVWIRDWRQVNSSFFTALQVERNVMFLILTLIILAAFNIISSQVMLLNDKGRGSLSSAPWVRRMILQFSSLPERCRYDREMQSALGIAFSVNIRQFDSGFKVAGVDLFQAEIYFLASARSIGEVLVICLLFFYRS